MADAREFSHITVTPHEEDEVVIHVGGAEPQRQSAQGGQVGARASAPEAQKREEAKPVAKKPEKPKDSYRETTLEDLERQPMSLTQKIVIIAAVLLLVGFAAYYVFVL